MQKPRKIRRPRKLINKEAPLLNDFIFKRTFTKEGTEPLLRDFLEAVLKKKITHVEVKNNEIPKERQEEKGSTLDIRAQIDGKEFVNIEMQVDNEYNLKQRSLLYACKNITTQLDKENKYTKLKPSIGIWILNFNYYKVNSYHSVSRMMFDKKKSEYVDMGYKEDEEEEISTDMLEIHFIEMPKFLKKNPGIENKLDQWLWLISGKGDKIKMVEEKNRNIKEALARVDEIMQDKEIIDLYFDLAIARFDEQSRKNYAKEQGMKKGMEKGMEKGIQKSKNEIAKGMKIDGIPIEKIEKYTGLSREEIDKL